MPFFAFRYLEEGLLMKRTRLNVQQRSCLAICHVISFLLQRLQICSRGPSIRVKFDVILCILILVEFIPLSECGQFLRERIAV